ncbi:hypothetical protein [Streptomyces gardneri]
MPGLNCGLAQRFVLGVAGNHNLGEAVHRYDDLSTEELWLGEYDLAV